MLTKAEKQMAARQYTKPTGDNAFETYQQILDIDPDQKRAKAAINNMPDYYAVLIRQLQSDRAFNTALSTVKEAQHAFPDYSLFHEIERELHQSIVEMQKDNKVDKLLAKAEEQLASLRLTAPKGDNASETYRMILEISPDNAAAKTGYKRIADRYADLATSHLSKGNETKSLAMIEKGLNLDPGNTELLKLKDSITQARKSAEARKGRVTSLLRKADNQFNSMKLVNPVRDNAYEPYSRVLERDPGNQKAKRGIATLTQHFEQRANASLDAGDIDRSMRYVNTGLGINPNNPGLLALKRELDSHYRERQRKDQASRKLEQLLVQAEQKMLSGQLTQPTRSSALALYKEVLELDPANPRAREGLKKIALSYENRARIKQDKGELVEGLSIVNEGLQHIPSSTSLLTLQREFLQAIRSEQKAAKEKKKKRDSAPIFGTF